MAEKVNTKEYKEKVLLDVINILIKFLEKVTDRPATSEEIKIIPDVARLLLEFSSRH